MSGPSLHYCYLRFVEMAAVSVRERGEQTEHGGSRSVTLADAEHEASLTLRPPTREQENNSFLVEMFFAHLPNEDDSRAYHGSIDFPLSRSQAEVLHRYLGFVLSVWD